jgi:hypothetical protein
MAGAAQAELREGGGGPESPSANPKASGLSLGKRCPTPGQRFERVGGTHGCAEAHGIGIAWEPSQISVSAAIRLEERKREREEERGREREGGRETERERERGRETERERGRERERERKRGRERERERERGREREREGEEESTAKN